MERMAVFWVLNTLALSIAVIPVERPQALPHRVVGRGNRTLVNPETGRLVIVGETPNARTIYTIVSSFCLIVLALLLGYRARLLKYNAFKKRNFTSILVLVLYFHGLAFIIAASVVQTGMGLYTYPLCYSAIIICLVFYTGTKLTIYVFLLERARIVRAPFVPRHRDWLWIVGIVTIVCGFGTIAIIGYMYPIADLSKLDGRCRIGLPTKVSFPLLSFDVGVNFLLTGIFFILLRPTMLLQDGSSVFDIFGPRTSKTVRKVLGKKKARSREPNPCIRTINRSIKALLWKCLIGSMLIMLPTVGNMAQFYIMGGPELGWICLTICTLDVSWGVVVVNWLTVGSAKAEETLQRSIMTLRGDGDHACEPLVVEEGAPIRRKSSTITTDGLLQAPAKVYRGDAVIEDKREDFPA